MSLHIIDFSDGIRSEEIQDNFNILDNQIKRTRLSVGGSGIASGLDITPIVTENQFAIKISQASIVDDNGNETFIEEQIVNIERPKLSKQREYLNADINNQVQLKEIPYMLDRTQPAQYGNSLSSLYTGINISYQNSISTDDYIRVKAINGNTLTLTGLTRRQVVVEYYSTAKRIDTVYLDEHNKISVKTSSITSTTPSAILPEKYNYLIAYILIDDNHMVDSNDTPHADIILKKDLRKTRNIYTDKNGILYLNGVAFNDLHLITTEEPVDPKPGQLWLKDNTLYVWQSVDNYTYKRNIEITSAYDFTGYHDIQTNIDYCINKGQLKVYINSVQLQKTEYDELFGDIPTSIQDIPDNTYSNKFRIYKDFVVGDIITYTITISESGYRWVPINKESYVRTKEHKVYGVDASWPEGNYWTSYQASRLGKDKEGYPYKYSYFIFDANTDRNMLFSPANNEVDVMINQMPLHKDQYSEIMLDMLDMLPPEVKRAISDVYGWDDSTIHRMNELYDDVGIGVMLNNPLDSIYNEGLFNEHNQMINESELYVEIIVNRACSAVNNKRKLQRVATFIDEDSFVVDNTFNTIVDLKDKYYRYNENQLDIYINGVRLTKEVDYIEGTDLDDNLDDEANMLRYRGAISKQFKIIRPLNIGDVVSYKITSNFYSYDHINSLLDKIETDQEACNAKVETLYNSTMKLHDDTNSIIKDIQNQVSKYVDNKNDALNTYLTRESIISEDQLAADVVKRIPQSLDHIYHVITFESYSDIGFDLTNYIREEDFILIWWRDTANNNIDRMLLPDENYFIETEISNTGTVTVYLKLTEDTLSNIKTGDKLIIRGIKFGRAGR